MGKKINCSICLNKMEGDLREWTEIGSNGNGYLNFEIIERKEKGQYGDTHFIKLRKRTSDGSYMSSEIIGNGKEFVFEQKQAEPSAETKQIFDDGLPF